MIEKNTNDSIYLMCAPEFYSISGPDENGSYANSFAEKSHREYLKNPKVFRAEAKKQWSAYRATLQTLGVQIIELEPQENHGDLVFTADPTLSLISPDNLALTITSQFSNTHRQIEVEHNIDFIEKTFPERGILKSHFNTEGTGDNYYDPFRDIFWSGYTNNPNRTDASAGRSDLRSHFSLHAATGVSVVSMEVRKPYFHIDTCMTPLSNGHIISYKDGMSAKAFDRLIDEGFHRYGMNPDEYLILADKKDAEKYACNMRCVDNTLIMPEVSQGLQDRLKRKGYEVVSLDMNRFINDGGAMHCLTNNVNERRIVGGSCVQKGYERKPSLP